MLCFRKLPVVKKFMAKRGGGVSIVSVESYFVSQYLNISYGNPLVFH